MDILEIYPKKPYEFTATKFSRDPSEDFDAACERMALQYYANDGFAKIWGDDEADAVHIRAGEYLVICGPLWSVMNSTEIMDDFRIG